MATTICIPARVDSERLPGKLMLAETGKPLIVHTAEAAVAADAGRVVVATDSKELVKAVRHVCETVIVDRACWCGTQRVWRAVLKCPDKFGEVVINLQGDEPGISPKTLRKLAHACTDGLHADGHQRLFCFWTVCCELLPDQVVDQNVVKAAIFGDRIYWFSRQPLAGARRHVGVYAFPVETLHFVGRLKQTWFSHHEKLEQLTWIEHGLTARGIVVDDAPLAVNTPDDYRRFVAKCRK